jgi:hypothetical protein
MVTHPVCGEAAITGKDRQLVTNLEVFGNRERRETRYLEPLA